MTATVEPATSAKAARAGTAPTPADVIRKAKEAGVQMVDVRFTDLPGTWQHFSLPLKELTEAVFAEGIGLDGSSIRGFQAINESDMLLVPDPASAFVDPCLQVPTLALTCDVVDPVTGEPYSRDPRYVARKAEQYLIKTGIATTAYYGPEAEFYIFNSVRFDQNAHEGYYHIDSEEGIWNSGSNGTPNLGHRPRHKEGYFPVPPVDKLQDLRSKIVLAMLAAGVDVEGHHHEVGTARWYIGGLIKHSPALLAFAAPTTNSYRRLVPGFEAPINLIYSQRNRSAICRIPVYSKSPKAKRVEYRAPDPACNPYLTFAALLLAGLDGIKNKIEPPKPMDVDLYELEPAERKHVKNTPGSLQESLAALEADHAFLLDGGVFTQDLIDVWLAMKRAKDVDAVALRPHPYEFFLYYDA